MKRMLPLIFLVIIFPLSAQEHTAVDVADPVYRLLENGELRGVITRLSAVKPYPKGRIVEYLREMEASPVFSEGEKKIIRRYIERFTDLHGQTGPEEGNFAHFGDKISVIAGADFLSNFRVNTVLPADWHLYNLVRGYLRGDISEYLSYYGCFGFTFDRVRPETFVPYGFTKRWDSNHIGFGEPRYSVDGIEEAPYFSFFMETDTTLVLFENDLYLRFARLRRDWGVGEKSLTLSDTARPFLGADLHVRFAPWLALSHTTGSLSDRAEEGGVTEAIPLPSFQKMYTLQMLEAFPFDWLYLSANAAVIWGKRLEFGYLAPLLYSVIYQNTLGNFENAAQEINLRIILPPVGSIHFSFFADEMEFSAPADFISRPRNMVAFKTGFRVPVPKLPFTTVSFQYTKIEPFTYAHMPEEDYPYFSTRVDMSFTHDGENLGYPLQPNSDEWLVRIETVPHPQVTGSLQYQLVRHGTNDPDIAGTLAIYGDIEEPMDYQYLSSYPDKNFLEDGIYDWNNIVTLGGSYSFKAVPIRLGFEYAFSHTFWRNNESGVSRPDPKPRNIFSFQVEVFR